jgi:hypothetical protein
MTTEKRLRIAWPTKALSNLRDIKLPVQSRDTD